MKGFGGGGEEKKIESPIITPCLQEHGGRQMSAMLTPNPTTTSAHGTMTSGELGASYPFFLNPF